MAYFGSKYIVYYIENTSHFEELWPNPNEETHPDDRINCIGGTIC